MTKIENDRNKDKDIIELILSASRVKTYQQCARKYYYNYIEKLPRKDWLHFDLGTLVHGVLEYFHADFRTDSKRSALNLKKTMKEAFKKQRETMEKEKPLDHGILLEARDLLSEYLKRMESEGIGSEIIALEDNFRIDLSEKFGVQGYVDRIDRDQDGVLHIKDYKTNKNRKYMEPFQLKTYGIYLLDKFPETEKFRGSYVMMRFGGMLISYDFNKEDVIKIQKKLIEYAQYISEEERWLAKPSRLCDWCDFKSPCLNTW
jgi:RecB family exonuclease